MLVLKTSFLGVCESFWFTIPWLSAHSTRLIYIYIYIYIYIDIYIIIYKCFSLLTYLCLLCFFVSLIKGILNFMNYFMLKIVMWNNDLLWFHLILWHINHCRSFDAKPIFIHINSSMSNNSV